MFRFGFFAVALVACGSQDATITVECPKGMQSDGITVNCNGDQVNSGGSIEQAPLIADGGAGGAGSDASALACLPSESGVGFWVGPESSQDPEFTMPANGKVWKFALDAEALSDGDTITTSIAQHGAAPDAPAVYGLEVNDNTYGISWVSTGLDTPSTNRHDLTTLVNGLDPDVVAASAFIYLQAPHGPDGSGLTVFGVPVIHHPCP